MRSITKCQTSPRGLRALAWLPLLAASFAWAGPGAHVPSPPPRCDVRIEPRVEPIAGGRTRITAIARNPTAAPIVLTIPGHCPDGPVQFGGLPGGYDYYGTCAAGACFANPARAVTVPARGEVALTSIELSPKASACTKALAPRTYALTAHVTAPGVAVCDGIASWTVPGAPPPPSRPAPHETVQRPAPKCPRMPACGLGCPGPFAHDANGCTLCACEREPIGVAPARH